MKPIIGYCCRYKFRRRFPVSFFLHNVKGWLMTENNSFCFFDFAICQKIKYLAILDGCRLRGTRRHTRHKRIFPSALTLGLLRRKISWSTSTHHSFVLLQIFRSQEGVAIICTQKNTSSKNSHWHFFFYCVAMWLCVNLFAMNRCKVAVLAFVMGTTKM